MTKRSKFAEACEQEPIDLPGSIQPFGALVCVSATRRTVMAVSKNIDAYLAVDAHNLLGAPLDRVLLDSSGGSMCDVLERLPEGHGAVVHAINHHNGKLQCQARVNRGAWLLELEPASPSISPDDDYFVCHNALAAIERTETLRDLAVTVAQQVQEISGFERVMIYRFDDAWNGEVFSEALIGNVDSYLNQRFPASDIPAQARRMLMMNRLRIIPDALYEPVPLLVDERLNLRAGHVDLSVSTLRSVSPIHLEYLNNMRVQASLTISLLDGERLWGLIACHHRTRRYVPLRTRAHCELVGRVMSSLVALRQQAQTRGLQRGLCIVNEKLVEQMAASPDIISGLLKGETNVLALAGHHDASAAIFFDGRWSLLGSVPSLQQLSGIIDWLRQEHPAEEVFVTDMLPHVFGDAHAYSDLASGMIAASLPKDERNYLFLFRPEEVRTIDWAGQPQKIVDGEQGSQHLHPRKSFALWQEVVRERSLPWHDVQVDAVTRLRRDLVELDLERQTQREHETLAKMAAERHRFAFLADVSAILASGLDYEASLRNFCRAATRDFCDWCVVYMQRDNTFVRLVIDHATPQGKEIAIKLQDFAPLAGLPESPVMQVFSNGEALHWQRITKQQCNELGGSDAYGDFVYEQLGLSSLLFMPVAARGHLLGAVKFARSRGTWQFDEHDKNLARELCRRAAQAVDNAFLYNASQAAIAARDHVLGVVSHDLRNPIGAVQLNAQRLAQIVRREEDDEVVRRTRRCVDRIEKSCRRMFSLIEDMLNLSKIEAGRFAVEKTLVPTTSLLAEVEEMLEPLAASRQLRLIVKSHVSEQNLHCEPERLMQVFSNLVGNAIKFTPIGGEVKVELLLADKDVLFSVSDNGCGIRQEDLTHIFDRFWQSERAAKHGAGLGLAIAKGIVEAHGGSIWVRSHEGLGSTFYFTLPRAPEPSRSSSTKGA